MKDNTSKYRDKKQKQSRFIKYYDPWALLNLLYRNAYNAKMFVIPTIEYSCVISTHITLLTNESAWGRVGGRVCCGGRGGVVEEQGVGRQVIRIDPMK